MAPHQQTIIPPRTFDLQGFTAAVRAKDADRWSDYFDEDAEWLEFRHDQPPSHPHRMQGNIAIHAGLRSVCAGDYGMEVEDTAMSGSNVWFRLVLTRPDGSRVLEHVHLALADNGLIHRQTDVEAWDLT
ncbi:nuclear transport factor 2 family protein [Oryzihumus sp.]